MGPVGEEKEVMQTQSREVLVGGRVYLRNFGNLIPAPLRHIPEAENSQPTV